MHMRLEIFSFFVWIKDPKSDSDKSNDKEESLNIWFQGFSIWHKRLKEIIFFIHYGIKESKQLLQTIYG